MTDVVTIYEDVPRAGTFIIAEGFEREHKTVLNLIYTHEQDFIDLENTFSFSKGKSKTELLRRKITGQSIGRPINEFLLNEQQTIFLGSLFRNTSRVIIDFKKKLAIDFIKAKQTIEKLKSLHKDHEYQTIRKDSKLRRVQSTDQMKEFVEYAIAQGSKNADKYYMNISKMMNGILFIVEGKFKNLREVLSVRQLMTIGAAEQIIDKGLKEGMKKGIFYKEIYQDIKSRVMQFAELHGKTKIIEDALAMDDGQLKLM